MIVIAILFPTLYFLLRRRWIGFWISLLAMAYSTLLFVTLLVPLVFLIWGIASAAAVLDFFFGTADRKDQENLSHRRH